jgi:Leucine-rich repeat (LRR) protein
LKCLQNRKLEYLQIPDNSQSFSGDDIILKEQNCGYLLNICAKYVELAGNRISGVTVDPYKTRFGQCLETLYISHNDILRYDAKIGIHLIGFYPNLRTIYAASQHDKLSLNSPITYPVVSVEKMHFTCRLSPILQVIDYSNNYIHLIKFNADFTVIGKALEDLYISNTNIPCNYLTPFQTPNLRRIDISGSECSKIPFDLFTFSNNLTSISASNAKINFQVQRSQYLFKDLSQLQTLDLSYNDLATLPKYLLSDQNRSLYFLNLDNNLLNSIPFTVSKLTNLSFLYVRHNRISGFQSSDIAILN